MIETPLLIRFFLLGLGTVVGVGLTGWSLWRLIITARDRILRKISVRGSMLFFYLLILLIGTADLGKVGRDFAKLRREMAAEQTQKAGPASKKTQPASGSYPAALEPD